jgi:hypothetical protein
MKMALYIAAGISVVLLAYKFRPSLIREVRLERM